jgi:hypothetical protein
MVLGARPRPKSLSLTVPSSENVHSGDAVDVKIARQTKALDAVREAAQLKARAGLAEVSLPAVLPSFEAYWERRSLALRRTHKTGLSAY